jgi:predicted metalloprotease with PDZ domain
LTASWWSPEGWSFEIPRLAETRHFRIFSMKRWSLLVGALALAASLTCIGQSDANGPAGPVALTVRLPNPGQKIFYVHEVMPVRPGPLALYYPKYTPGDHAPDGPIGTMMGLEITSAGKRIAWLRDEVDMFTFHLTVPAGVDQIDITFQFPDRERVTSNLMGLAWNEVALYQAGYPTKVQVYEPTLVIPANWQYATALTTKESSGGRITFKPVPFNTLVDSPVIAGKYFRELDLTPAGSSVHRYLDMVGDNSAAVDISDAQAAGYRRLVEQAQALFHSHHYDNYHFLLTLSDYVSRGGLEHHQSSDDRARSGSKMFADPDHFMLDGSLLPHEYTHSWNGKFMRPAELWQPDFEIPEHPRMLWVYEGLTVYLGDMLTARSGLWSPDTWRETVAYRAADMAHRPGREWRPLIDTTIAAQLVYGSPNAWSNWRRETDFYREGELLWLAVDMKIRTLSSDQRSIDDFARQFFSVDDGSFITHTYTFNDVVGALNTVEPFDWASFLNGWLDGVDQQVPLLSGIDASGWRLVYSDQPSRYQNALENVGEGELEGAGVNAMFSVGLFLDGQGKVEDVLWNGPAFKAGLAPGMELVAIDGHAYSTAVLRGEIAQARKSRKPLQITAKGDGVTGVYTLDNIGGLDYPHLVRVPGTTDYLEQILAPKSP